jgi:golgi phosphoprotein 3
MLTMLEEVVLLAVDEKNGRLRSTREFGTAYALVGAVFFDLALARRIDTGTDTIRIVDASPTGNPILDRMLARMAARPDLTTVREWIEEMFLRRDDLEGEALQALITAGVLRHEQSKLLWIIDVERFPMVNNKPQQHVKMRLAQAILTDEIPETRDIMLVSIADQCGLLSYVLSDSELDNRRKRIGVLSQLETISRQVGEAIVSLDKSIRIAMTKVV